MKIKNLFLTIVSLMVCFNLLIANYKSKAPSDPEYKDSPMLVEDGHDLWLRYAEIQNPTLLAHYRKNLKQIVVPGESATAKLTREELKKGLSGLLGQQIEVSKTVTEDGAIFVPSQGSPLVENAKAVKGEGYLLISKTRKGKKITAICAKTVIGGMYGAFGLLRLIQTEQKVDQLNLLDNPKIKYRMLNHWDSKSSDGKSPGRSVNLGRWNELPEKLNPVYTDYARANASIGINGTVLNNFTTDLIAKEDIIKVAELAKVYRPYGVRVYLSVNFASPMIHGELNTADPKDSEVQKWWKNKADEIYSLIPDFGGFLVKADSEGMPGPQKYNRSHAEAANMLAAVLKPHEGILIWRAFVYDQDVDPDRAKRSYMQFKPLDGEFAENVIVQVKNGPMDFQPREPFHPLWGSMPNTPLAMEFEIYKEYLGKKTDLVYLGEEWEDILQSKTYENGEGAKIARVVDGSLQGHKLSAMAGVGNINNDPNWTGHPFNQANWYAFGRLAWNPDKKADTIGEEWARMTWGNDPGVVNTVTAMMDGSWQAAVNVMTPLGLNFVCARDHYTPDPAGRVNDYWYADENGIGYNRTDHPEDGWGETTENKNKIGYNRRNLAGREWKETGSGFVDQYNEPLRTKFNSMEQCPEEYLLWFHFVPWDFKMNSGRSLWEELCYKYQSGYDYALNLEKQWGSLKGKVDEERFELVSHKLEEQEAHYKEWRDVCIDFFAKKSGKKIPDFVENLSRN